MHPPKAYDPAQRSDAAEYQRDCVEVLHKILQLVLRIILNWEYQRRPCLPQKCYEPAHVLVPSFLRRVSKVREGREQRM